MAQNIPCEVKSSFKMKSVLSLEELRDGNIPYHKVERLDFDSPETFRRRLQEYPLDKDFIDWVKDNGWVVKYDYLFDGGLANFKTKRILVGTLSGCMDNEDRRTAICYLENEKGYVKDWSIIDFENLELILMHELIHVAVPNLKTAEMVFDYTPEGKVYEGIITEEARTYIPNRELMKYIHSMIPHQLAKQLSGEERLRLLGLKEDAIKRIGGSAA